MVSLYLNRRSRGNDEDARRRREWLDSIGAVLGKLLGGEARMWLITCLSSLEFGELTIAMQVHKFLDLFQNSMRESAQRRGESAHGPLELRFTTMFIENKPGYARRLIKHDTSMFERLFSGHPKRILFFFDRFAVVGQTEHQFGAHALANFAFRNRNLCWHRLVWEGTHAHSPATVAAKPQYFMELDVVNTVQNFLEYVPEFWRSKEFRESLKSEVFWDIDRAFFAEYLADFLARELDSGTDDADEIWTTVREFISDMQFPKLCQQLLHLASDETLLMFINGLGSQISFWISDSHTKRVEMARKTNWMEVMVYSAVQWKSLMDPIFCNACIGNGRKLLRILQEEEHEEDANDLKRLIKEGSSDDEGKEHWPLTDEVAKMDKPAACRYLALEAFVLFYQLSSESTGDDLYKALLKESGIKYYRLPSPNIFLSDKKRIKSSSSSSKRSRKKKHRSRHTRDAEDRANELAELLKEEMDWVLSIDNFQSTWTKADLPEELTGVAVPTWLDWLSKTWC